MLSAAFLLLPVVSEAQAEEAGDEKNYDLNSITISAKRKLSDMGVTKTELDSLVLLENISNSLADVLSQKTPVFIKSYGRGTVATASFRGTSPSHTQVLWNGIKINSPMLGMVDFSLIPSYFISDATLYHGGGSIAVAGGGLGGAISLVSKPVAGRNGWNMNFVQGISSFMTFDDFLNVGYSNQRFSASTKLYYTSSRNDFKYTNYFKKNEDGSYPVERNKNGPFRDMHLMQEISYVDKKENRFSFALWGLISDRGVPMLNVNYREEDESENSQYESTIRISAGWNRTLGQWNLKADMGYTGTFTEYSYKGSNGYSLVEMVNAQSQVYSLNGSFSAEYFLSDKWSFSAVLGAAGHDVSSYSKYDRTGYDKIRPELSGLLSVKYRPFKRLGFAVNMREEMYGDTFTPLIPAGYVDFVLWPEYNLVLKGSVSANYRMPSLNDLYYQPGGNPDLKPERGFTYEGGVEISRKFSKWDFEAEVSGYNSRITDWIVWLPDFRGFWTPVNVRSVHSYGVETRGRLNFSLGCFDFRFDGFWAWTRSINYGDPASWADESIGKQLVYIPEFSSGLTGSVSWRNWTFVYRYNHYSERYTTSSNDKDSRLSVLGKYYMNDISLEKRIPIRFGELGVKGLIYNLFDEEYVSVLSRPMPGINFGLFISYRF